MKKNLFAVFSIITISVSMFAASHYSKFDKDFENNSSNIEVSEFKEEPSPYKIEIVESHNHVEDLVEDSEMIYEPAVEEVEKIDNTSLKSNNSTNIGRVENKKENTDNQSQVFSDNIAGKLADPTHVPCGGLWEYYYDNFYAREIKCAGSDNYLNISKGEKINIAGKSCTMVGAQNLNYNTDTMDKVKWYGNTIVQTCYHGNTGNVRLVNFNCG